MMARSVFIVCINAVVGASLDAITFLQTQRDRTIDSIACPENLARPLESLPAEAKPSHLRTPVNCNMPPFIQPLALVLAGLTLSLVHQTFHSVRAQEVAVGDYDWECGQ